MHWTRNVLLSASAMVVVLVAILAVYAAMGPPPSKTWTLPIPAGTVLAFNENVQGIVVVPPSEVSGMPTGIMRQFSFTVPQSTATVVGAWSFSPASTEVYAGVIRGSVARWESSTLGQLSNSPYRANVTPGNYVFVIVAFGAGNLTVTQTIQFY